MHSPYITPYSPAQQYSPLRPAALPESAEAYPHVQLNAGWRVIECRDGIQWILQYRNSRAETVSRSDWRGRSYCRTRQALIACCDRHCGPVEPATASILSALPEVIGVVARNRGIFPGSFVTAAMPVATATPVATSVISAPVKPSAPGIVAPRKILARELPENRGRRPLTQMQAALLEAAKRRVARNPTGQVMLPIGEVDVGDLGRVLHALDRARADGGR
jgi:hypothetical protein